MKKIFVLFAFMLCAMSLQAQTKYAGKYFTLTTPSSAWEAVVPDAGNDGQSGIFFTTTADGESVHTGIVIVAAEGVFELEDYLDYQIEQGNPVYDGAKFTELEDGSFLGYESVTQDFTNSYDGQKYVGAVATFATEKSTYFVIVYSVDKNADFASILEKVVIHK
ncbi:MAG: hypothetical protein R3Y19_02285 [Rikenellaceae bacterium]